MNRNWKKCWAGGILALVLILGSRCLFGQTTLPTNWWQGMSPDAVWKRAETITSDLAFLRGIKRQLKTDPNRGYEHLQRRTADGFVETKSIDKNRHGGWLLAVLKSKKGKWLIDPDGITVKLELGENAEPEVRFAKSIAQPYSYRLMESVLVGTNACIVISRTMTAPMFDAILEDFQKNLTKDQVKAMILDGRRPDDHISSEKQCFIRQLDGVVMGYLYRNPSGRLTGDHLSEVIWVNEPIPEVEFIITNSPSIRTAHSGEDVEKAAVKHIKEKMLKTKIAQDHKQNFAVAATILGVIVVAAFMWRFRRRVYR